MHGLYSPTLELGPDGATERPDPAVLALLTRAAPPVTHARIVPIVVEDGVLRIRADLSGLSPMSERPTVERLLVVAADVLDGLRALRAAGRAHGDLRLAHLWFGPDGARLTCPAPVEPGPLAMARMRAGTATADALAFVAPELIAGGEATPAGDVFALSATLYAALVGRPPLGALEPLDGHAIPAGLRELIRTGLLHDPTARPALEAFSAVLEARQRDDATASRQNEETGDFERVRPAADETGDFEPIVLDGDAVVARTTPGERAAAAELAAAERLSPLVVVLAIGGLFTIAGAALLAFQGLQGGSALEALLPLFVAAALLAGGGAGLLRFGHATSGRALILVALQVGWAIAGASFRLADVDGPGPYGLVGAAIGGACAALAIVWRSGPASGLAAISLALAAMLSVNGLVRGSSLHWAIMPITALLMTAAPLGLGLLGHALRGPVVARPSLAIALFFAALGLLGLSLDSLSPRTLPAVFAAPWIVTAFGVVAVVVLERAREELGAAYRTFAAAAVGLGVCATAPMHLLAGGEPRALASREALCLGAALLVVAPRWRHARATPTLLTSAVVLGALNAAVGLIDVSRSLPWREALGAWFGVSGALALSVAHATRSQAVTLAGTGLAAVAALALAWRAPEDAAVVTLALATPLLAGAALLLRECPSLSRAPLALAGLLLCASAATGVVGRSPWWPHVVFLGGAPVLWLIGRKDAVLGVGGLAVAALAFTTAVSAMVVGDAGTVAVSGAFGVALAAVAVRGLITPRALVGACAGVTASLGASLQAVRVTAPVDTSEGLALVTVVLGALLAVVMALVLARPERGRATARCVEVAALLPPTLVLGLGAVLQAAGWAHLLALLLLGLVAAILGLARRHLAAATAGLVATLLATAIGYVTHVLPAAPVPVTLLVGGLTIMGLGVAAEVGVRRRLDSFADWA